MLHLTAIKDASEASTAAARREQLLAAYDLLLADARARGRRMLAHVILAGLRSLQGDFPQSPSRWPQTGAVMAAAR